MYSCSSSGSNTGGWSLATLSYYLAEQHLLLVLDNCEHLLDSCALLAVTLLKACPELRVLATSRQGLGVTGETRLRVPPLSLPEDGESLTPERLATYEAVALLTERATAVLPGFKVDRANVAAVLRLCRRLDGMPLALELAAVRLEGMTVEQVVSGLENELPVLARGSRGVEARQQTLEATIGWSYGLLEDAERLLWARLSVFSGGFNQAAAATVCSDASVPAVRIAEMLASLVEKSIIRRDSDRHPGRYSMLETVRQYGRERPREVGDEIEVRRRHRNWIRDLAIQVGIHDHREAENFNRVELEIDNLWSALDFCRREPGEALAGPLICRDLYLYWYSRGPLGDVRRVLDALYSAAGKNRAARGYCRVTAACLAALQGDADASEAMAEESVQTGRALGDRELIAWGTSALLLTALYAQARHREELLDLATTLVESGESVNVWYFVSIGHALICRLRLSQGNVDAALEIGEPVLEECRRRDELFVRGAVLNNLAEPRRRQGRLDLAEALAREGAAGQHELGSRRDLSQLVETLAWMASDRGAHARAATLLGYAQSLRESILLALLPVHQARHGACEQAARSRLGDSAFQRAFEHGARMLDAEAIACVLERQPARTAAPPAGSVPSRPTSTLTRRELEIARLIAEGLTSQQIAARLFISERTVTTHVTNMLNKLGLSSGIQLARWVAGAGERSRPG